MTTIRSCQTNFWHKATSPKHTDTDSSMMFAKWCQLSNTWFTGPTSLSQNNILISSSVFVGLTTVSNIQTTKRKTCVEGGNRQYLILLLFYIENSLHLAYFPVNFRKQTVSFSVDIRIPLWEFLQRTLLDCDLVIQIPYVDKVMVIGLLQPLACLYFFNSTRIAKIWCMQNRSFTVFTSVCRCRWSRSKGERTAQWQRSQTSPWT